MWYGLKYVDNTYSDWGDASEHLILASGYLQKQESEWSTRERFNEEFDYFNLYLFIS